MLDGDVELHDEMTTLYLGMKDPAHAPDRGRLQGAYNRVWCWLNSPVEEAKKL